MPNRTISLRPLRAKLIFNAISGRPEESPQQLVDILAEMQTQNILPEVFMVGPDSNVDGAVRSAVRAGTRLIVVAGGDGTIDSVAGALVGTPAVLGIIPTGTRNNVAFNLGIPETIAEAVGLLRKGRRLNIDVGHLRTARSGRWFIEAAALGLISDLYPAADGLQHGDLGQIGNLLSGFVASSPSRVRAVFGSHERLDAEAYMVLIANMPFLGPRLQVGPHISCRDSQLDVFVYSEMTKLDLISIAVRSTGGAVDDAHVRRFRASQLHIRSEPNMPVLADGVLLEEGPVTIRVHPRALSVMTGRSGPGIRGT